MVNFLRCTFLAAALFTCFFSSQAQMRITEWMYDATPDKEFVEYTNVGSTPIDMTGWKYSDNGRLTAGSPISLSAFGTVQPGESVIFTENTEAGFRAAWNVCSGIKIIGGSTTNLGRSDEVNLYDASNNLIDRLTYGDQTFPGTIRTSGASGWVTAAGLGANNPALWTLSTVGDAEGSYTSTGAAIGSPGKSTRATIVFTPACGGGVPGAPTIVINGATTSNFLDAGLSVSPASPYSISGVKGDAGDPASTLGIDFTIGDDVTAAGSLLVTAVSSNQTVVPAANVNLTGTGADRNLKITPAAMGYSDITITVTDGDSKTTSYIIKYAASQSPAVTPVNYWPTGIADASAAIALDDNYMLIANDESNLLYVFDRKNSGLPVVTFDFNQGNALNLTDGTAGNYKEVDLEAGVRSIVNPGKIYWMGSMSNNSSNDYKANRDRLFATTVSGTGAATTFADSLHVDNLRNQLIAWGDTHGYDFTTAAADHHSSKAIDGFNIEGMVFGPDNTTMYIGFRAPLVPLSGRVNAVIAPVQNFEAWFNDVARGNASIGAPIELNLGGRGVRDLIRLSNGNYIIIAGSYDETAMGAIYKWTGNAADAPTQISSMDISALNVEAVLPINAGSVLMEDRLQVISDNGDNVYYGDGIVAKDLATDNFKKFSSNVMVAAVGSPLPITFESFTANKQNKSVVLNWKAAQMEGVEKFEILRSVNGADFTSIGFVPTVADQTLYSYKDNTVTANGKVYYRLRSIEHGSVSSITPIRFVDFDSQLPMITLYPNPVVNNRFSIMADKPGAKTVTVIGSNGNVFRQLIFNGQVTDVSTIGWPKGWYLIKIRTVEGAAATYKVIVP
jgi:hypothetical protein